MASCPVPGTRGALILAPPTRPAAAPRHSLEPSAFVSARSLAIASSACSLCAGARKLLVRKHLPWHTHRGAVGWPGRSLCAKKADGFDPASIEPPPYHVYYDSTSGQLEPASGARASIPGKEYWPEGTAYRVRAARAPEPAGESVGSPSFGKSPGSRRKYGVRLAAASDAPGAGSSAQDMGNGEHGNTAEIEDSANDAPEATEGRKDPSEEFVIYKTESEEYSSEYEMRKKIGLPHPFVDPSKIRPVDDHPLPKEELWWNWQKPEQEQWSRWQRRRPDVDTVFAKAMAETGQIKLYGDYPTKTEAALAKARKDIFKEERLEAERRRLEEIGPIAYYSEWVSAWNRDTSREAIQKHYEETGEDENTQLITMFQHQTAEEYRIMMGTDVRIRRDPLAMRMREDLIKEIWGGDPVYPTVNYIQEPNQVIDYRGPEFHEPTPNMLSYLMEEGLVIPRSELEQILSKEKTPELEITDIDEAMATAVDIGENDDEDSEEEGNQAEKVTRSWSVLKTTPQPRKAKEKPKKDGPMSLEEAVEDSENLTDFLMDFEGDP